MHWHYTDEMIEYLSKRFRTIKKINQKINTIEGYIDFILFIKVFIYIYIYIYIFFIESINLYIIIIIYIYIITYRNCILVIIKIMNII